MWFVHLMLGSAMLVAATGASAARLEPAAKLAKLIDGRVAGEPVHCITLRNIRSTEIVDRTAIVYTMTNGTVYVNRPNGASFLDDDSIMVNKVYTSQLCNVDIVDLVDRSSRFHSGSVGLGDFVPYPRPPKTVAR